jgi:hypothetical protein
MRKILHKYVRETGQQWVKLPKHTYFIRQMVGDKLRKLIRVAIDEKKKL